jgi:hypothetical protein
MHAYIQATAMTTTYYYEDECAFGTWFTMFKDVTFTNHYHFVLGKALEINFLDRHGVNFVWI